MATQPRTLQQMNGQIDKCLENCWACHRVCLGTITQFLEMGGEQAQLSRIRLLRDSAEICQTTANFLIRNSEMQAVICSACAEICLRCAKEYKQFGSPLTEECVDACERCAESCQLIVANSVEIGMV